MKKKILIVEDEEHLRLLYEEELKEEGYDVALACNGKEALLRVDAEKPDLIILDIVMPVMDGTEDSWSYYREEQSDSHHPQYLLS